MQDDDKEIMKLLEERLKLGKERYGHGVKVNDDTTKFGTATNDWELMLLEEVLDGMIYSAAAMIRIMRSKKNGLKNYNSAELFDELNKYKYLNQGT